MYIHKVCAAEGANHKSRILSTLPLHNSRCEYRWHSLTAIIETIDIILMNSMNKSNDVNSPWMVIYFSSLQFLHDIRPKDMPKSPWKPTNRASALKQFAVERSWPPEERESLYRILEKLLASKSGYKHLNLPQLIVAQDQHHQNGYERKHLSNYYFYKEHLSSLGATSYHETLDRKTQPFIYALKLELTENRLITGLENGLYLCPDDLAISWAKVQARAAIISPDWVPLSSNRCSSWWNKHKYLYLREGEVGTYQW